MKVVHFADLHLGFRQFHRVTATGANRREAEVSAAFARAVDECIILAPDLVVIAGDVFHVARPSNAVLWFAFNQVRRLTAALPLVRVVIAAGNHDLPNVAEGGCALTGFRNIDRVDVATFEARRFVYPDLDCTVVAVPDILPRPKLEPSPGTRFNVLLLHGEIAGAIKSGPVTPERKVVEVSEEELGATQWDYVALGHIHVMKEVAPNAFYSGSLEYTSSNPWGELGEERAAGVAGKGFIERDLESGAHTFHLVTPADRLADIPPIDASTLSAAEIDAAISAAVNEADIDGKIVRCILRDAPRGATKDLDHRALRSYRTRALNFQLDVRKSEVEEGVVAREPGMPRAARKTLTEMLADMIVRRAAESGVDGDDLAALNNDLMAATEEGAVATESDTAKEQAA